MIGLRHVSPYFVFFPCHSSHASALLRAPDMSKMEEVAASKPNFTGVWVLVKQSNSDAFLKVRTPRMECTCGGGVYTLEQARGANYIMRKASKALKLKHTITQVQCGRRVRNNCAEADVWSQDGDSFEVIMTANVPFFPKQVFKGTVGGPTIEQKDWLVSCVLAECIAGPPLTPVCASLGRPKRC